MIQKNWQEFIKPNKLQVALGADPKRTATLVAEPLERGFGVTLGNALRRILLSSLQGAAVQSVHIDGVLHEFSSIAGVREDVTDIVLNIKDISIKMQGEGPKRMKRRNFAHRPGCAVEATLDLIDGKWKGVILYHLQSGTQRFGELRRLMPGITQRMVKSASKNFVGGLVHCSIKQQAGAAMQTLFAHGDGCCHY